MKKRDRARFQAFLILFDLFYCLLKLLIVFLIIFIACSFLFDLIVSFCVKLIVNMPHCNF